MVYFQSLKADFMRTNGKVNGNKIKPSVTAIIQARMQSKRLPGKTMLNLAGKPLLAHIIERTKKIEHVDKVVVATCDGDDNSQIIDLAESMGVESFVGSMENVLERFHLASQKFGGDFILRITADNPFIDVDYASMIVDIALDSGSDYYALSNLPLGAAIEVMKKETLEEAYKMSEKPYQQEHVTPFIKEHPELFSIERPKVDIKSKIDNIRLTVDTPEDYGFAKILYENLYKGESFPLSDVLNYIEENPDILLINNGVKQRFATHSEAAAS